MPVAQVAEGASRFKGVSESGRIGENEGLEKRSSRSRILSWMAENRSLCWQVVYAREGWTIKVLRPSAEYFGIAEMVGYERRFPHFPHTYARRSYGALLHRIVTHKKRPGEFSGYSSQDSQTPISSGRDPGSWLLAPGSWPLHFQNSASSPRPELIIPTVPQHRPDAVSSVGMSLCLSHSLLSYAQTRYFICHFRTRDESHFYLQGTGTGTGTGIRSKYQAQTRAHINHEKPKYQPSKKLQYLASLLPTETSPRETDCGYKEPQ
ncbi:hypothetical protein ACRALDRAFT_2016978 [Sodiomyces alcalophilus JCM 7366]|uniref:uncharacterized protein n=1 Tax=Sodiomyces alcalophilus JCM 7366 TaxID=591952 RepID=UPI0039B4E080